MNSSELRLSTHLNRQIWLTVFIALLPSSQLWIAEEYIRTKVTRQTNDEYELFPNSILLMRSYFYVSPANKIITSHVNDLNM